jgi:hypothetical protein
MTRKQDRQDYKTGAAADDLDRLRAEFEALVGMMPVVAGLAAMPADGSPLPDEDEVEAGYDNMPV